MSGGATRTSGIISMTTGMSITLARSTSEASQNGSSRCSTGWPDL